MVFTRNCLNDVYFLFLVFLILLIIGLDKVKIEQMNY